MNKYLLFASFFMAATAANAQTTITSPGLTYSPDLVVVTEGETVVFQLSSNHNAVEISKDTWLANGSQGNGGFNIPFGGGSWTAAGTDTLYYVCTPHAAAGMKGRIVILQDLNQPSIETLPIQIFPNPFSEAVNFIFPEKYTTEIARISDVTGRTICEGLLPELQHLIPSFPAGIYYLQVSNLPSQKLIKTNSGN